MNGWIVFAIIVGVFLILFAILFIVGKRVMKKQDEQKAMLDANKQMVSMLVIDKKKLKIKDANLPAAVIEQVPKMSRGVKMPMAKVKIGPQIITMFCDPNVYEILPVKKEVKAEISGLYIVGVKGVHGTVIKKEEKKKNKFQKAVDKLQEKAGAKPVK